MNTPRILVTGSSGLVGTVLTAVFRRRGYDVECLDLRAEDDLARGDICDARRVSRAIDGCDGIVHLAAVSRVITAEHDPKLCWSTNVEGLRNVIDAALTAESRPWLIFASSREVYGQPAVLPADEDCPLIPVNIYGRAKVAGEGLIEDARRRGLRACTIRLSNVFGTMADHQDRVVPAFARAVVKGLPLRVEGSEHTFDFTHISDVARGIDVLTRLMLTGDDSPRPIHFVSGIPTTLGELAELAIEVAGSRSTIQQAPPRTFDVTKFVGDRARAKAILGWEPEMSLRAGLKQLIGDLRAEAYDTLAAGTMS